jgi:hypothetical protein
LRGERGPSPRRLRGQRQGSGVPEFRALRAEYSAGRGSRRRAKAGGMDDPNWLFCIRPALETCVVKQRSLVLLVQPGRDSEVISGAFSACESDSGCAACDAGSSGASADRFRLGFVAAE